MKKRNNLLLGVIIFIVVLWFNAGGVKATEYGVVQEGNIDEHTLDDIPSTMKLDIKESEMEQAEKNIFNKVKTELAKKNIIIKETEESALETSEAILYVTINGDIKHAEIRINNDTPKEITIEYSNSKDYNEKDKKAVEDYISNIDIPKNSEGEYVITQYKEIDEEEENCDKIIQEKVKEQIKDNSIKLIYRGAMGDRLLLGLQTRGSFYVFKNDVYYKILYVSYESKRQVIIPNEIEDIEEEYIKYATPKIQDYIDRTMKNYAPGIYDEDEKYYIEKLEGNTYKVLSNKKIYDNDSNYETIIIKKAESKIEDIVKDANVNVYIYISISIAIIILLILLMIYIRKNEQDKNREI